MTIIFEELFHAWCQPYRPEMLPSHLRSDPIRGYGQYAFEEGFKLAIQLIVTGLDVADLQKQQ